MYRYPAFACVLALGLTACADNGDGGETDNGNEETDAKETTGGGSLVD